MKTRISITQSINELTDEIRDDYPEIYRFLEETPVHIPVEKKIPVVTVKCLEAYFNTLKFMLKQHAKPKPKI